MDFPKTTAIGALAQYVSQGAVANFQPMNVNFGIMSPLEARIRNKQDKNLAISNRALETIQKIKGV